MCKNRLMYSQFKEGDQTDWLCEYSKSYRSKCKTCSINIIKNDLRFGIYFKVNQYLLNFSY